jgi:Domain of unknown function (DUF4145)
MSVATFSRGAGHYSAADGALACQCTHCLDWSWWWRDRMIFPLSSRAPLAHPEMPEEVAADYAEARSIADLSPRGACALLRLAVQKLCQVLGEPGKNINDDIKGLAARGLLPQVQQALDALRVIGNNAVHPGELDLRDDRDTALALFVAMNLVVEQMIAAPKHAQKLYETLPQGALDAIKKRDGSGS